MLSVCQCKAIEKNGSVWALPGVCAPLLCSSLFFMCFLVCECLEISNNWHQSWYMPKILRYYLEPEAMALVPQGVGGSSVSMSYPVLSPAGYKAWEIKVEAILDAQGVTP